MKKVDLLSKFNLMGKIDLNGKEMIIPVNEGIGFSNLFLSEKWMIDLLKLILPEVKGSFVDVGVNTGQTLLKIKSVHPNMSYIGFEPNPYCVNYINALQRANNFEQMDIYPIGLSAKTSVLDLNFYDDGKVDSRASIVEDFRPDQKVYRKDHISVFSLPDSGIDFNLNGGPQILKIDVEGAEWEVLKSFETVISEHNPVILMEILPVYSSENTNRLKNQNKILDLLKRNQYDIYRVRKDESQLIGFERIDGIEIHSDLNLCEYVFVHSSMTEMKSKLN